MRSKYILAAALAVGLTTPLTTHAEEVSDSVQQAQTNSTHTVQPGETLWRIATNNGVSVDQIKAWNGLQNNNIYVGQVLSLVGDVTTPVPQTVPTTEENPVPSTVVQTEEVPTPSVTTGTYTVKSGDSLWSIANKHGISIEDLKRWNNLTSNYIYSGTQFVVQAPNGQIEAPTSTPDVSSTPSVGSNDVYTAVQGDYLYKIARNHGITLDELRRLNNLTSDIVRVGQKFVVTNTSTVTPNVSVPNSTPSSTPSLSGTYTAVRGDYLWKIATENGITVDDLKRLNNLTSNEVRVGQVFRLGTNSPSITDGNRPSDNNSSSNDVVGDRGPATTSAKTYTVNYGDTLYRIALNNGLSVSQLKQLNGLTNDFIAAGQVLKVTGGHVSVPQSNTNKPATSIGGTSVGLAPSNVNTINNPNVLDVPDLSQRDPRWANSTYGNDVSRTIAENGCAIVSLAMVDSYYRGEITNPTEIANWAGLDHYLYGVGTTWTAFDAFAKDFGYTVTNHGTNFDSAMKAVQEGNVGVVSVAPGYFINGGHIMALKGYDASTDQVFINDPYDTPERNNNGRGHASSYMKQDARGYWTFGLIK